MAQAAFPPPSPAALARLKQIVGPKGWKAPGNAPRYFEDPRGRFTGQGCLIVMPRTPQDVAAIVTLCGDEGIGVVPYSGGTGVVAGQLSPHSGNALIVSLERMNAVREVSPDNGVMVVEAGCILETLHATAAAQGMTFPLDMASKGSCCIGGNLATNAGGIQVLRHGNVRDLCLGIEAVLPDGSILSELAPLHKNNTGYDLRHLLIGSEGTLGIITAATLRLKPRDAETGTAFLAVRSPGDGLRVLNALRADLGDAISAMELMSGFGIDLVTGHFPDLRTPFDTPTDWALLMQASGPSGTAKRMEEALATCLERGLLQDAVLAQSETQAASLWALRENTPEANRQAGAFCNSDTAVPVSNVDAFIKATTRAITSLHPGLRINSYGHMGDGNIHHNVFPPTGQTKAGFLADTPGVIDQVRLAINDVTHAHGGTISAEHGIGRLKTGDLQRYASPARLQMLRAIKTALDPKGIMNPGALIA